MNVDEKDIIILNDDHHYLVIKKIDYENTRYYYVSDLDEKGNVKFLYEDNNELVEIEDKEEINKIIVKMYETIDMDDFLRELKEQLERYNNNNGLNTD